MVWASGVVGVLFVHVAAKGFSSFLSSLGEWELGGGAVVGDFWGGFGVGLGWVPC